VVAAPAYFTPESYRAILERAIGLGYRVVSFREFESPRERPVLLLRHDLDHALEPARITAEAEASLGLRATYFVQTACAFYNLLSREGRRLIRELAEAGHEIGLHHEADRYTGEGGEGRLRADLRLLEDLSGQPVVSAAQHLPICGDPVALADFVRNDAYDARFVDPPMTYVSDSLMTWREVTPFDLLERRRSFQLLTHPDAWIGGHADMRELLLDLRDREIEALRSRYQELVDVYAKLLAEREARDARFRQRRMRPVSS
jgi:hypothetical protein